ncbi:MAG: hypothetical protein ABJL99_05845 [Aliishimia sp.]
MKLTSAVLISCVVFAGSSSAKDLSHKQTTKLMGYLERCVQASVARSSKAFDDWTHEDVRVPGVYLNFTHRISPDGAFLAAMGARKDHPGQPFICRIIRRDANGSFLSVGQQDRDIFNAMRELPKMTLAGVKFRKRSGFKHDVNASRISGCINGQVLVISPDITNKGAASFGVGLPLLEERGC